MIENHLTGRNQYLIDTYENRSFIRNIRMIDKIYRVEFSSYSGYLGELDPSEWTHQHLKARTEKYVEKIFMNRVMDSIIYKLQSYKKSRIRDVFDSAEDYLRDYRGYLRYNGSIELYDSMIKLILISYDRLPGSLGDQYDYRAFKSLEKEGYHDSMKRIIRYSQIYDSFSSGLYQFVRDRDKYLHEKRVRENHEASGYMWNTA